MGRKRDKDGRGSWVRLPALPLFGNVFQGAIIPISEDRRWHLSLTLKDGDRTAFSQRPHKHHVPGVWNLASGSLGLTFQP